MVVIDGSMGEGGGQVLRTALGLSLVTGRAVRVEKIRAGRRRPGLMRQHLTAVRAAAAVGAADVSGDQVGSRELTFAPGDVRPGEYRFAVGTAGSATLVLQTVLPALLTAGGPSNLTLEGGTHNAWAPPFDFLAEALLPLVNRMGPVVTAELDRHGFYPVGGGRFRVSIQPAGHLVRLELIDRGEVLGRRARALLSKLPEHIARRELRVVQRKLGWPDKCLAVETVTDSPGPGNAVVLAIESRHVTEVFTGFGAPGVPAESVARDAARLAQQYLAADVPVGPYLADQLLIPIALAGGRFRTVAPTPHTATNIEVIKLLLDVDIATTKIDRNTWEIAAGGAMI